MIGDCRGCVQRGRYPAMIPDVVFFQGAILLACEFCGNLMVHRVSGARVRHGREAYVIEVVIFLRMCATRVVAVASLLTGNPEVNVR